MPDDEQFRGWPNLGLDPNAYDPLSATGAHFSRELLAVEWPKLAAAAVDDPNLLWTSRTKRMVKQLLNHLGAQENLLANLNEQERAEALMNFRLAKTKTSAMCNNVDVDTPEFVQLFDLMEACALVVFSRSQEGWERILQATTIRRIEEAQLARKEEAERKKQGLLEKIVSGVKKPEDEQK